MLCSPQSICYVSWLKAGKRTQDSAHYSNKVCFPKGIWAKMDVVFKVCTKMEILVKRMRQGSMFFLRGKKKQQFIKHFERIFFFLGSTLGELSPSHCFQWSHSSDPSYKKQQMPFLTQVIFS